MKNNTFLFLIVATLSFSIFFQSPVWADEKGTEIASAVYNRPDGKTMVSKTTMILETPGSQTRKREFFNYRKDLDDGQIKSLIRFVLPADIKDTALLTYNHLNAENDQWLYLPALSSARRIAGDRKGGRFVGSDLYFEDLQDRKVEQDHHTFLRQEEFNGTLCDVVESIPVESSNSTYSKRITWVHPQTMIPIRIDFFGNADTAVKRMSVKKIDKIQEYWTVMETEITDLKSNHKTTIITQAVKYDQEIPESLFAQSILQTPSREVLYRP